MFCCCYYYFCCCWLPCHNIWVYDAILSYVNNLIVCGLSTVLFDHKRGCFYGRVWLGTVDDDNRHKPIIHGTSSAPCRRHQLSYLPKTKRIDIWRAGGTVTTAPDVISIYQNTIPRDNVISLSLHASHAS